MGQGLCNGSGLSLAAHGKVIYLSDLPSLFGFQNRRTIIITKYGST